MKNFNGIFSAFGILIASFTLILFSCGGKNLLETPEYQALLSKMDSLHSNYSSESKMLENITTDKSELEAMANSLPSELELNIKGMIDSQYVALNSIKSELLLSHDTIMSNHKEKLMGFVTAPKMEVIESGFNEIYSEMGSLSEGIVGLKSKAFEVKKECLNAIEQAKAQDIKK